MVPYSTVLQPARGVRGARHGWNVETVAGIRKDRAVPEFAIKEAPAGDKLRGGYYTPEPIARFIAAWVAEAGNTLLEPACGDGAIFAPLVEASRGSALGIELFEQEAVKARVRTGGEVLAGDFFTWFDAKKYGTFDGVAGNPPYIRFGSWDDEYRKPALRLMQIEGLRPTKLTNAWVPFVVAAVLAVREGGRVGLVLPAELLQVGYAANLRSYLVDKCSRINVVSFRQLVFPGIQQEVILLLAERGVGPAKIRTIEVSDENSLGDLREESPATRAQLHETEKWTKYYLDSEVIEVLRRVRSDGRLARLDKWAEVDVGVVSGRNSFFCLTRADAERRRISPYCLPLVSRSQQIPGLTYADQDLAEQDAAGSRTRLLALTSEFNPRDNAWVANYLAAGEADGVPTGYKCRIRRHWWVVPTAWVPDGFMLRQISTHPRIVANEANATCTDTLHRVRTRPGVNVNRLAVAAYNSATFALSEIIGRSYGGGILELEPSEAEALPIADPSLVPPSLLPKVDELSRMGRITDALDLLDQAVLIDGAGFTPDEVAVLRRAWEQLRDRRKHRGRSARKG